MFYKLSSFWLLQILYNQFLEKMAQTSGSAKKFASLQVTSEYLKMFFGLTSSLQEHPV